MKLRSESLKLATWPPGSLSAGRCARTTPAWKPNKAWLITGERSRKIWNGAKDGDQVVGGLPSSRSGNTLSVLAVDPAYRRKGIATAWIARMLEDLAPDREVWVTIFREKDPKGTAPKALYRRFGFVEAELVEELGYPGQ